MPHHKEHTTYQPDQVRRDEDESGIHKDREAIGEREANIPTRGEPQSEGDRTGRGEKPTPASEPRED